MSFRYLTTVGKYSKLNIAQKLLSNNFNVNNVGVRHFINSGSFKSTKGYNVIKFVGFSGLGVYSVYKLTKNKEASNFYSVLALEENNKYKYRDYLSIKPTRKIRGNSDNGGIKLTFFQYQSCPFCCKVRAYLDFHGLSYDIVEVNSVTRKEIKWAQGYKKVPILMARNEHTGEIAMLKDSSAIISCLHTAVLHPEHTLGKILEYYPTIEHTNDKGKTTYEVANRHNIMYENKDAPADFLDVKHWREWTDTFFVHTISPNIYRTPSEALDTFHIFSKVGEWEETFSSTQRSVVVLAGAAAMYFIGKRLKKRHDLSDDVRQDLYAACDEWLRGVRRRNKAGGGKFMGGEAPNLADLSVYGVLNAMEGTQAFNDALDRTKVGEWFYAVKSEIACKAGKRVPLEGGGEAGVDVSAAVKF